jgi:hypothetical protein
VENSAITLVGVTHVKSVAKRLLAMTAAATVATLGFTEAFAATKSSFESQYKANLKTEQSLLAKADKASNTNKNVSALLTTVQNINNQVTALYAAEQALANAKSSIPQVSTAQQKTEEEQLKKLMLRRETILKESNAAWKLVNEYEHHKSQTKLLKKAIAEHNQLQKELESVNSQIASLKNKMDTWKIHPYDGGLTELQDSILKLQQSAIHYTQEAISLEK